MPIKDNQKSPMQNASIVNYVYDYLPTEFWLESKVILLLKNEYIKFKLE